MSWTKYREESPNSSDEAEGSDEETVVGVECEDTAEDKFIVAD